MASLPQEIDDWPTFSPTTPHFFKIILKGNTSSDAKLRIPKKFVMKYGDDLSNPVSLELPSGSGSAWKVDLRRLDGEVWFDKGWADFSEFYSLDRGHWLVFGYQGNSKFHVCIFDRTCTEVDYPLRKQEMEETDDTDDDFHEDSTDDSVEEQPDDSTCPRKTRKKSSLPCPRPQKKNRTSSRDDYPAKLGSGSTSSTRRFEKRTPGFLGSIRPLPKSGKATALQRANAYKSQHPLSVIVAMKPSYITGYILWLPSEFHNLYPIKNSGEVILRVLDRRTWPVNLKYGGGRAQFLSGWMKFVLDNNLKVNDVCVFELIDNKVKPLFDVVIFPNIEAANCPNDREQTVPEIEETNEDDDPSDDSGKIKDICGASRTRKFLVRGTEVPRRIDPVAATGKDIALQRAKAFKSEYPFCWVLMHHSYIHRSYLRLPAKFSKEHIDWTHENIVLHVPNGRTWPVKSGQDARGRVIFLSGWTTFVRDNNLEVGDACVFELINDVKPLFDVVLFYATKAANCTLSPADDDSGDDSTDDSGDESDDNSIEILDDFPPVPRKTREKPPHISLERAVERANSFASKYPFFKIAMHATYIHGHHMNLSSSFVKENLNQTSTYAILRVSDGRTWSVKLDQYGDARTRFQGGWMDFVRENSLVIGDVCVFVLVNNIKPLFDVAFYRTKSKAAHCTLNN